MSAQPAATVLLTGDATPLGGAVQRALKAAGYDVRAAGGDATALLDPDAAGALVQGVAAIVHLAPLFAVDVAPPDVPGEALDIGARGTHVLLKAALEAGVRRVVQGSTLAVMDAYDESLEVTEQWRPRPRPVPAELAPYVAELVAREFTRDVQLDEPLSVICLRFDRLGAGEAADPVRTLSPDDAAQAVIGALDALSTRSTQRTPGGRPRARGHRWQVLHVAPRTPEARYTAAAAERAIGYGAPLAASGAPAAGSGSATSGAGAGGR